MYAEAEEDSKGEDDSCKDEVEEEGVQKEVPLAPPIDQDQDMSAREVDVENPKGGNIDQSYKKYLQWCAKRGIEIILNIMIGLVTAE